jgi:hypothetical protein
MKDHMHKLHITPSKKFFAIVEGPTPDVAFGTLLAELESQRIQTTLRARGFKRTFRTTDSAQLQKWVYDQWQNMSDEDPAGVAPVDAIFESDTRLALNNFVFYGRL